jgi:hypothetical protein
VNLELTSTQVAIAVAAGIVGAGYIALILVPAISAYGRFWERCAAAFLTLFILGTLIGGGAALGLAVVWSYDQYT